MTNFQVGFGITNASVSFQDALVNVSVKLMNTNYALVDIVTNISFYLSNALSKASVAFVGKAVNDPRFNWDGGRFWPNVNSNEVSWGGFNSNTYSQFMWADDTTNLYIKNAPIQSVGELGFLCYDENKPWTTIRLIGADPSDDTPKVLDRFSITTNQYVKGAVNPNSKSSNVLASVFYDVPVNQDTISTNRRLLIGETYSFVSDLIDARPFANLSDISRVSSASLPSSFNSFEQESIIRNSIHLLSPRQNIFTIILAAQSMDSYKNVVAEQRALAVVWRDPYPDSSGHHDMFVRFFKWLDE